MAGSYRLFMSHRARHMASPNLVESVSEHERLLFTKKFTAQIQRRHGRGKGEGKQSQCHVTVY